MNVGQLRELIKDLDDSVEIIGEGTIESGRSVSCTIDMCPDVDFYEKFEFPDEESEDGESSVDNVLVIKISGQETYSE